MSARSPRRRRGEGGLEEDRVVAVGPVADPADRDAIGVGEDRPLPAELRPIGRVLARSLSSSWAFVQTPVDGHLGEVEADDLVVCTDGLGRDRASKTPASSHSSRRARTVVSETLLPQRALGVLPAAARHQAHQHHLEAVPVGAPWTMTTQRMQLVLHREQGFYGGPDGIERSGLERAHDGGVPPRDRWTVGKHPDCLGAITTTSGWSGALRQKCLTASWPDAYQPRPLTVLQATGGDDAEGDQDGENEQLLHGEGASAR